MVQVSRSDSKLITRYADKEDLPEVYVMYLQGLADINAQRVNEEKALNNVLLNWAVAPCVLLIKDDEIVGFAGLTTLVSSFSDVVILKDYMFYIQPAHRGIRSWRTLCKAVQDVADKYNMPFIGEHLLSGDSKHHERLIKMAGAKPIAIQSMYGEIK